MPVLGQKEKKTQIGRGYLQNPIAKYAAQFQGVVQNMLTESSVDLFTEANRFFLLPDAVEAMKEFFVQESADREGMTETEYNDHMLMMEQQFENNREAIFEYAPVGNYNPIIGLAFPIHKNILMQNVFNETGGIPKAVAATPKFTMSMESRYLVSPDGKTKIDIWKEQDKIKSIMDSVVPYVDVTVNLPERGTTNVLGTIIGDPSNTTSRENIDIDIKITKATISYTKSDDSTATTEIVLNGEFKPGYGDVYDRMVTLPIKIAKANLEDAKEDFQDTIFAMMKDNSFEITSSMGLVNNITLTGKRDSSNGQTDTPTVEWKITTDLVEIPTAAPINIPISPEEVKDVKKLYDVDQLSKIMSICKDVMGNWKDDNVREFLDKSYVGLDASQKDSMRFDFAPRKNGYAHDHVTWRHDTFFDAFDSHVTKLLRVLKDPNMVITIYGRPDIIRKLSPVNYDYVSPDNIGPVDLEFTKTVFTSNKRCYQFISTMKMDNTDELIVLLKPRNTERIIYRLYDYQFYISNEIRNATNPTLPAIHMFDRYKMVQYQPVQGRVTILNPSGLRAGDTDA